MNYLILSTIRPVEDPKIPRSQTPGKESPAAQLIQLFIDTARSSETTVGQDRRVYRRRETSLQPRYRAIVAQRVSRNGVGISNDSRLSENEFLRALGRPGPITGNLDFSSSASCNSKQKRTDVEYT